MGVKVLGELLEILYVQFLKQQKNKKKASSEEVLSGKVGCLSLKEVFPSSSKGEILGKNKLFVK